ncbi:MAG: exo-alpha-sialidase [Opitutales bacterium]|nr:exo-alpha-sialidase [Opitutales bacterium]MCH8541151.1 glycoside hydrolase [Opitutales bacterium]
MNYSCRHLFSAPFVIGLFLGVVFLAGEEVSVEWEEPVVVDEGEAFIGPWRMNESDFRYVDDPTAVLRESGEVGMVWVDQSRQDVLFQRFDSGNQPEFDEPVNVSNSPDIFSWLPRIVMLPRDGEPDQVFVLWQEIVFSGGSHGGEIFFARSTDGGRNFEEPVNLSQTTAGAGKGRVSEDSWHNGSLDLAINDEGDILAVWTEYEGALRFSRSTDGGKSFSDPLHIAGDGQEPARGPDMAVGPDNHIHLVWTVGEDPAADIRYAVSQDGGESFTQPSTTGETSGRADAPVVEVDPSGTVHLVYAIHADRGEGSATLWYARRADGEETFAEAREITSPLPANFSGMGFPSMTLGKGPDDIHIVGLLFQGGERRPVALGWMSSSDGGETFTTPKALAEVPEDGVIHGGFQGLFRNKVSVNNEGEVVVSHSLYHHGDFSQILLLRGRL